MPQPADQPDRAWPRSWALGAWRVEVDEGGWRHTEVDLGPDSAARGTERPLTALVFSYLDVVTGSPPSGGMNPTVDLQVRLFRSPRPGLPRFRVRTLRLGRTLYVGEVELRQSEDEAPLGVAVATFMNQPLPFPERIGAVDGTTRLPSGDGPDDTSLAVAKHIRAGAFELGADLHASQGTVPGATLGLLTERAARDLLGATVAVDELDVRFLHRVRRGPLRASAVALGVRDGATNVRVEIVDSGNADRLVTYALAVYREMPGQPIAR